MRRAATSAAGPVAAAERRADVDLRGHRERVGGQREHAPTAGRRPAARPAGPRRAARRPPSPRAARRRARSSAPTAGARRAARRRCPAGRAGPAGTASGATRLAYAAAASTCAATVPHAEPGRPACSPNTSQASSATFTTLAPTAMQQRRPGVLQADELAVARVGQVQEGQPERRDPDVARRRRTRCRRWPPSRSTRTGATSDDQRPRSPRPSRRRPSRRRRPRAPPRASRRAPRAAPPRSWWRWTGRWPARRRSTARRSRSPARRAAPRPRWPTIAVSARLYSGSAAIAPSAGIGQPRDPPVEIASAPGSRPPGYKSRPEPISPREVRLVTREPNPVAAGRRRPAACPAGAYPARGRRARARL